MVRDGQDFVVNDAKTGDDITRGVLAQIIFEEEAKGQTMLPATSCASSSGSTATRCRASCPGYLEASMETFARNQEAMREQVRQAFEANPALANFEALARSNMEWFENAMRMFAPFATGMAPEVGELRQLAGPASKDVELEQLKEQLAADAAAAREARQGPLEPAREDAAALAQHAAARPSARRRQFRHRRRPAVEIALQAVDADLARSQPASAAVSTRSATVIISKCRATAIRHSTSTCASRRRDARPGRRRRRS